MATQYDPIAKDESLNTTETPSRNIADVLAEELEGIKNAIGGGGGSGGHTIYDADEQAMPQRAGLGFTDAHVSDNSGDDRTDVSLVQRITDANWALLDPTDESNNGFYQIGNSPLLHLGYVGNGEKKDFDAGAQSDYVEVVGDGVKTYSAIFNELYALVDTARLTNNSTIQSGGDVYHLVTKQSNRLMFTRDRNTTNFYSVTIDLSAANSHFYSSLAQSPSTVTNADSSSSVVPADTKFTLYYNDAHTFDFNTKAENCIYDNTSSGLAATNVQGAIDKLVPSVDSYTIKLSDLTWATENAGKYYAIAKPISDFSGRKVIGVFLSNFGGLRSTDVIQCWFNDISGLILTSSTTSFAYAYSNVTVSVVSVSS